MIRFITLALLVVSATGNWQNNGEICFGAKNDTPGKFKVTNGGKLIMFEIEHTAGFVSCVRLQPGRIYPTRWSCQYRADYISMIVSTKDKGVIFPNSYNTKFDRAFQRTGGFNSNSSVIAFSNRYNPTRVAAGDEISVWYGEDFYDSTEHDNQGRTCGKVRTYVEAIA